MNFYSRSSAIVNFYKILSLPYLFSVKMLYVKTWSFCKTMPEVTLEMCSDSVANTYFLKMQ